MATYWHHHPRGFANECTMVLAVTEEQAKTLQYHGFEQLTEDEARGHVLWVCNENRAWNGNMPQLATNAAARKRLDLEDACYRADDYIEEYWLIPAPANWTADSLA